MVDATTGLLGKTGMAAPLSAKPSMDASSTKEGGGFMDVLKKMTQQAPETARTAEDQTIKSVFGQTDLPDLISAVSNAEMTLQTVVSIRDKAVSAYQEIMRMPV